MLPDVSNHFFEIILDILVEHEPQFNIVLTLYQVL